MRYVQPDNYDHDGFHQVKKEGKVRYERAEKYPAVFYPTTSESLSNKSVYVIGIDKNALVTSATTLII